MKSITPYEKEKRLHSFFLESAKLYPNEYALLIGDRKWTYSELEYSARCMAQVLVTNSSQIRRIGIYANKSYITYVGVLASLFTGAAYIPLNRTFPIARTLSMIKQSNLDAIIVDNQSYNQLKEIINSIDKEIIVLAPEILISDPVPSNIRYYDKLDLIKYSPLQEIKMPSFDDDAYILFTSGSTGIPKGVPISHQNVVGFLEHNMKKYQFTHKDCCTQTFDLTFDLSVFDLFMTWGSGACLCVMQPIELLAPINFLKKNKVTVWYSVPSVISLYRKRGLLNRNSLNNLRISLFCGEALILSSVKAWQEAAPQSIIENLYGPTELTIACSSYRWNSKQSPLECKNDIVPIGEIYPHLNHMVIDEELKPLKKGEEGELCVSGVQMFRGYLNNPEQTQKSLIQINGKIYYRTGDIVQWKDGHYIYLRRIDHQTKVQGYRIELGEIESAIRKNEQVIEAAALPWPIEAGEAKGLVAFVAGTNINMEHVKDTCKMYLPHYMQPQKIYILDSMPYNSNGKIDYNSLKVKLKEMN